MALLYPHKTIWINHREVTLEAICNQLEQPRDAFEEHTFGFIREWLSEATFFTLITSGSTGKPKPIQLSRNQLIFSAQLTLDKLNVGTGNALVCLDTRYIAGRMMLVRSFLAGLQIHAFTPTARIIEQVADINFELAAWVPMQVYEVLKSPYISRLNNIRHLLIGGAPLHIDAQLQLTDFACSSYITYGMTETISHVALLQLQKDNSNIFSALPQIHFDQDDRGCLIIHAPHIPEAVITNDVINLLSPTEFQWQGRWDNVINTGGVKVIPEVIEQKIGPVLMSHGIEGAFFVSGLPHPSKGEEVTLFLEGVRQPQHSEKLITAFQNCLDAFQIPRQIVWFDPFVRTENGKLNRAKTIHKYFENSKE